MYLLKWAFKNPVTKVMSAVAVFTALLIMALACASAAPSSVRELDPIQLEVAEKGEVLAVVDNYRIYKIEDGRVSCYLAIWPGQSDTAISCVSQ